MSRERFHELYDLVKNGIKKLNYDYDNLMRLPHYREQRLRQMTQVSDQDVKAIRDWLAKEPHLPKDFSDKLLKRFIYSCYGSLEATKKCIDKFCTYRRNMPEVFTNRDPTSAKIQTAFSTLYLEVYDAGSNVLLIDQLINNSDKFDFYNILTVGTIQTDYWFEMDMLNDEQIYICDLKLFTLQLVTKVNILYLQKLLLYFLESAPLRLRQIHLVNCPPYMDYLYNLIKPVLPEEIRKIIKFHPTFEGLYEFVDKKYLPKEFGGEAAALVEKKEAELEKIISSRELYMNNDLWKADLTKKPKAADAESTMNGSFRSLTID